MASNVFGIPITDTTLWRMPEYHGKTITRKDRAHVALNRKNAQGKAVHARNFVEELKHNWGIGISTLCLVYNATGDTLEFVTEHDYHGHVEEAPFPQEIENGQWGGFLHGKTRLALAGSSAAVVYRGKNPVGDDCDWMLAWTNPLNKLSYTNNAYTEIHEAHYYEKKDYWGMIADNMEKSGLNCIHEWNGCVSEVSIGDDTTSMFEAIMTLKKDDA